jgi:hypothetical protein
MIGSPVSGLWMISDPGPPFPPVDQTPGSPKRFLSGQAYSTDTARMPACTDNGTGGRVLFEEKAANVHVYSSKAVKMKRTHALQVLDAKRTWPGFLRHLKILARLSTALVKMRVLLTDISACRRDGIWYIADGKLWQSPKQSTPAMLGWGVQGLGLAVCIRAIISADSSGEHVLLEGKAGEGVHRGGGVARNLLEGRLPHGHEAILHALALGGL